jgi:D-alanyl-D-alanine dipeptidase
VDATLVDAQGRELEMPTGFDAFTPAAKKDYDGGNATIAANLRRLQEAMAKAGFAGLRDEWWHFVAKDFAGFGLLDVLLAPDPAP